ncbi:pentatricopeptide repeat-containing protein At2g13600-like [Selaginella moellendorffii]|uniref:pentatricopeptide repeat-containing protein At2g13600-like n=1 Tax=Selaginella moellendorffii TaxID=88036 RepID=UPI000D1C5ABD|nr:pentatricopeptide repeat-containing protein At2g13600-like [Selaginella moellendorffii]|eukprot:XP_024519076.1 pentatricopeptide repeat-containing protein At2g13600-like [Selaginella moellendorffii]
MAAKRLKSCRMSECHQEIQHPAAKRLLWNITQRHNNMAERDVVSWTGCGVSDRFGKEKDSTRGRSEIDTGLQAWDCEAHCSQPRLRWVVQGDFARVPQGFYGRGGCLHGFLRWMGRARLFRGLATAAVRGAAPAFAPSAAPPRAPDQQAAALVSALKVCGSIRDLRKGKAIHAQVAESKQLGIHVVNALVDMYAKCGSMEDSRRVFDSILHPNVMSWNVLMLGYVSNGESDVALDLFERMQARRSGCKPNSRSFMAASKACSSLAAKEDAVLVDGKLVKEASLGTGRGIHSQAKQMGPSCSEDVFLSSSLIDMYSKCGSMLDARSVFDGMPRRDVVSWNALILGYVENGESEVALEFFGKMDCSPNSRTFVAAAKACANLAVKEEATQEDGKMVKTRSLEKGLAVHAGAMESHCCGDIFVGSSLVDMYSKCGSMADARMVFESMPRRDVVLWTSLMQGFVDNGESELALVFFEDMKLSGCCPNSRTYVAALAACASSALREEAVDVDGKLVKRKSLETGVAIQGEASNKRCCEDVFVGNTLIDMYAKCGKLEEARKVFDGMAGRDVVSWNAMIQGSVGSGDSKLALELFFGMRPNNLFREKMESYCESRA